VLAFVAAVHGGIWEQAAQFTPTAMVAEFQHGLIRLDAMLISIVLIVAGLGLAAIWTQIGVPERIRAIRSAGALIVAGLLIVVCATMRGSWDVSENRMNSFPASDEAALERIAAPLKIEVHLAPEDPRRSDLERRALSKLRRVLPNLDVAYASESSTGLFEQAREDYGEIRYSLDGRTATSRATTVEGVLDTIYDLAGVAPASDEGEGFRGHPLNTEPYGAAQLFYLAWPAAVAAAAVAHARRQS